MNSTLTFGKHKNETIEDVYASDPGYCRWLKNQPNLVDGDIMTFLESKLAQDDGSYLLTWGKYKNKSLKAIHSIDPNYVEWLCKNQFVIEKCPRLVKELAQL
jgi:hypothetical protein